MTVLNITSLFGMHLVIVLMASTLRVVDCPNCDRQLTSNDDTKFRKQRKIQDYSEIKIITS